MTGKRVANGLGGILCLTLGGYACVAAVAILLGIKDRPVIVWMGGALIFALGVSLVLMGMRFGARAISGEMPPRFMSEGSQQFGSRRLVWGGYTMMAFPIWGPLVEEGRLRWPSTDGIPVYLFMFALGLLMVWGGRRAASAAED